MQMHIRREKCSACFSVDYPVTSSSPFIVLTKCAVLWYIAFHIKFGPLAQWLEQGTHNPLVLSSSLRWPIYEIHSAMNGFFLFLLNFVVWRTLYIIFPAQYILLYERYIFPGGGIFRGGCCVEAGFRDGRCAKACALGCF